MRQPNYITRRDKNNEPAPKEKFSLKEGTAYITTFYFLSLAAGGVIFYQYFSNIQYLPTIEVSMIFWAVLFVFTSGFLLTTSALIVVLFPSFALYAIDWILGIANKNSQTVLRNHFQKLSIVNGIFLSIPWLIWPIYYYYYFRHPLDRLIYTGIFLVISFGGTFIYKCWLPNEVRKFSRLFFFYFIAVGTVVSLDYDISSFLFQKPILNLPVKNNVDTFLMIASLSATMFAGLILGKKTWSGLLTGITFGTLSFLLMWESPDGNTLSKSIMTRFKLGHVEVAMTLNKDYVKSLSQNTAASQVSFPHNAFSGRLLTRLGTEYVVEVKTCVSCHGKNGRNILSIPKDKVETIVILERGQK